MDDQKRFLLAMVLSGLILMGYFVFYAKPLQEEAQRQAEIELAAQPKIEAPLPAAPVNRDELISTEAKTGTRIEIDTPSLSGSFSTTGSKFDDLSLKNYNKTLDASDGKVILFTPKGADHAAYVFDNWTREGTAAMAAGEFAQWGLVGGDRLTPTSPIELQYEGDGFVVNRLISVDEHYLITLKDTITNTSGAAISLVRAGAARQHGLPEDLTNFFILQEGPIAVVDNKLVDMKYKKLSKKQAYSESGESGWAGLTDKYWLSAAVAPQDQQMAANFRFTNIDGQDVYEAGYALAPTTLSPGFSFESTGYIYAGAKRKDVLSSYMDENNEGIARMDLAVDYGFLGILTRPMSWALTRLGKLTGNFGVGILVLTLILKIFLFPLNNKAYSSMAKMKALQPKMEKMKKRYGDDRMKLQQEMMAMYRKEGVSPVAGCLPMIPQMFIFFALYKSLFITLEMRHAPFFGWIKDLSAKDPLSVLNLFGALPWDPVPFAFLSFFAIGPLALMYGISMAMMQTLNTPPADKMQARIFQLMPLFFMFILAPFAAGLLVYWVWNNILSLIQQYFITRKYKVHTPLDTFFEKITGKKSPNAPKE